MLKNTLFTKNHFISYTVIILLFFTTTVSADINLILSDGTSLLALNGKTIEKGDLTDTSKGIKLPNGRHQILVQHTAEIETPREEEIYEKTDTFVILFSAKETDLYLTTSPINTLSALKAFNTSPTWVIKNNQNKTLNSKISPLIKEGVQFGRNYEEELRHFNRSNLSAAHSALATPIQASSPTRQLDTKITTAIGTQTAPAAQGISHRTLVELYQQASPVVQRQFIEWLQQQ